MQPTNLLNPILFTILGDAITLAKCLSSVGLFLDVLGVVILLTQDLRTRKEEAEATNFPAEITQEIIQQALAEMSRPSPPPKFPDLAPHIRATALLRGTRAGFVLILAGFVLQLIGTLIS